MTSPTFLDRFKRMSAGSPLSPRHSPPGRIPSEYDLDELEPRPDDGLLQHKSFRDHDGSPPGSRRSQRRAAELDDQRSSSVGSASKYKPRALFSGPPPPIAASVVLPNDSSQGATDRLHQTGFLGVSRAKLSSVLFDHKMNHTPQVTDTIWRGLQRQEKALESDIQKLLDLQAAGLVAGLGGRPPVSADFDEYSDTGSSTPTGTFYSTATSRSHMINSLHAPARANAEGNVIPVRQPRKTRPPGLKAARNGLRKSMVFLADLKTEEDAHIDAALSQRKKALLQLDRLSAKREDVYTELHTLEVDHDEPLGQEMRELGSRHDALTEQIHQLEQKLVGMRNRRRLLKAQMDDVRNRKEAGLSGYRGALRDVDEEVSAIMRRPQIQPLDPEIIERAAKDQDSPVTSSGHEFLQLIPERRTAQMAKEWWQEEVAMLERRKAQIASERKALEDGSALWADVMNLVTQFEARLRLAVKTHPGESDVLPPGSKGKSKVPSQDDVIREQLPLLRDSILELERHMKIAEGQGWTLLICAIGAELEAFKEAHDLLHEAVDDDREADPPIEAASGHDEPPQELQASSEPAPEGMDDSQPDESDDNEVPPDLLSSTVKEPQAPVFQADSPEREQALQRMDSSDNEVPLEFLTEDNKHGKSD